MTFSEGQQRIIHTAIEIFANEGYHAASTQLIANAAGVTKALIFHHFRSKENLFFSCWDYSINNMKKQVLIDTPDLNFFETVTLFSKRKIDYFLQHPHQYKLVFDAQQNPPANIAKKLNIMTQEEQSATFQSLLSKISDFDLREGVTPQDFIFVFFAVSEALLKNFFQTHSQSPNRGLTEIEDFPKYYDFICNGMLKQQNSI